jgi:tRNA modification GTPase
VANKSDLAQGERGLPVSAKVGTGIAELLEETFALVGASDPAAMVNDRHRPLIAEAVCAVQRAESTLGSGAPHDLAAVDLQAAIRTLGEVTGETATADMIERVFREFCIGK